MSQITRKLFSVNSFRAAGVRAEVISTLTNSHLLAIGSDSGVATAEDWAGWKGTDRVKWMVTIETTEEGHSHVDVSSPDAAALMLNEVNDKRAEEGKGPAHARIESYSEHWTCFACGESRTEATEGGT